jgi:hypothetical protein
VKASLSCVTVTGPTGPYEVLRSDPIPTLFVAESPSGWQYILGDTAGLHRLAFLAGLAATRRDTVVHLPLRAVLPVGLADQGFTSQSLLDLVLAPHHVALRPKEWKRIRNWRSTERRRIVLPPLRRLDRYPETRVSYERLDARGMDRRVGAGTLILSGDRATFDGLAEFATWIARCTENWDGTHLDRIVRHGDIDLMIRYWAARQVDDERGW